MKQFNTCIFFIFLLSQMFAQEQLFGLYVNEKTEEFICIQKDTIFLKYLGCSCLRSYNFFYGTYDYQDDKIILKKNMILPKASSIAKINNAVSDSVKIQVLNYNDEPILAGISLNFINHEEEDWRINWKWKRKIVYKSSNSSNSLYNNTDEKGCVSFVKEKIEPFIDSIIMLKIGLVGSFQTEHLTSLKLGDFVIIKLLPFDAAFTSLEDGRILEHDTGENSEVVFRFVINRKDHYGKAYRSVPLNLKKIVDGKCGFELFSDEVRCPCPQMKREPKK